MRGFWAAVAMVSLATGLKAQNDYSPSSLGLSPNAIRSIQVRVADNASGACWTNLKEVREHAEEKLRIKGYNVVAELKSPRPPDFLLWIGVGAARGRLDACDGSVSIRVQSIARMDGFAGRINPLPEVAKLIHGASDNLNRGVLEAVQEMVEHM